MEVTVASAALSEPPRPNFAGHIRAYLLTIDIDPATTAQECEWGLTYSLRRVLPEDRRSVVLFKTIEMAQEPLRQSIAGVISKVMGDPQIVVGGYRPPSQDHQDDFLLYRTRPGFPWDYAIPGYRARLA